MLEHLWRACRLGLLSVGICAGLAAHAAGDVAGQVDFVSGEVAVDGGAGTYPLVPGASVAVGDTVRTGPDGEAHLSMEDGAYVAVRPNTSLRIDAYRSRGDADDEASFALLRGAIRSVTGWIGKLHPGGYRVTTAMATIGVRGTDHEPLYIPPGEARGDEAPGVYDRVNEGVTLLTNEAGTVDIPAGRSAEIRHGAARAPRLLDRPPPFLERRRTRNEALTERYGREIHRHIEERLQRRGLLKPGERVEQFFERHRAPRPGAAREHDGRAATPAGRRHERRERAEAGAAGRGGWHAAPEPRRQPERPGADPRGERPIRSARNQNQQLQYPGVNQPADVAGREARSARGHGQGGRPGHDER